MITFSMIPGTEFSLFLLVFLSLASGVISGFVGVGGGFIMTPALIILGFPAQYAVGTGMLWVMGNSIIGTFRHRRLGNVDIKLGIFMIVFMMCGVEGGVRALNAAINAGMADTAVLLVTICALLIVGGSIFWESARTKARLDKMIRDHKETPEDAGTPFMVKVFSRIKIPPLINFPKSGVSISIWVLLSVGVFAGALAGFIGVGGGFIIVPSLVYVFGVPSFVAVGTSLFQIIFPAAFGAVRYTMDGNVLILAAFIMILGSSAGIYFGALATRYLRDVAMRYTLAVTIFIAVLGSVLKVIAVSSSNESAWLQTATKGVTFGGLALAACLIIGLYVIAVRHRKGKTIPGWSQSFVKD